MEGKPQTGYLVFADISGYTLYLAKTELEHSQAILSELMELLLARLTPVLHLADLEGDAVFACVPDTEMARGETLLELIESTYTSPRRWRVAGSPCG